MKFDGFDKKLGQMGELANCGKSLIHFIEWIEFYEPVHQNIHWNKFGLEAIFTTEPIFRHFTASKCHVLTFFKLKGWKSVVFFCKRSFYNLSFTTFLQCLFRLTNLFRGLLQKLQI